MKEQVNDILSTYFINNNNHTNTNIIDTSQGKSQIVSNINACCAVAETVRTTLGPRGILLLLQLIIIFLLLLLLLLLTIIIRYG